MINFNKKTIEDIDVAGRRVLLRCDFNVPLDKRTGAITNDTRITAALPTIRYLLEHGAAVIACSHLGRPGGQRKPELSLSPVARRLSELLGHSVKCPVDVAGPDAQAKAAALRPGEVLLLENLRFEKEEEANDPVFAKALASMADLFVSDAFGTVHRAHASTVGVADYLPAVSGLLVARELSVMGGVLTDPKRPFVAILGGAKVSDKIGVIENLLEKADSILIGGGLAYTFLRAQGHTIGASLFEEGWLEYARALPEKAKQRGVRLLLPQDHLAATQFPPVAGECIPVATAAIPNGLMGMDIGVRSIDAFAQELSGAGTVVWNGPMGVFEYEDFAKGTRAVAQAMADSGAATIVGGGDSAAAVEQFGLAGRMTHVSTGGGASLELLAGEDLPGVACLLDK